MDNLNMDLQKYFEICEQNGWNVYNGGDTIELAQYSPLGEDFFFTVRADNFLQEVYNYAEDFDPDDHAAFWIENRETANGVPQSVRDLIDDADAIKEMLETLSGELKTAEAHINAYKAGETL